MCSHRSTTSSSKNAFGLQEQFRPRRHTNSRAIATKSPMQLDSRMMIKRVESEEKKSNSSSESNYQDSTEKNSTELVPRVKKISCEEAEQFRKDVLDPEDFMQETVLIHNELEKVIPARKISRLNGNVPCNGTPI